MTIEQAKSELMQIYGALLSNKQIAIDTLIKASVKPQEPKSEWEHDHKILKAYSDGTNEILDKIRAEIEKLQTYVLCKGDMKKIELADVLEIFDKYRVESEENNG